MFLCYFSVVAEYEFLFRVFYKNTQLYIALNVWYRKVKMEINTLYFDDTKIKIRDAITI